MGEKKVHNKSGTEYRPDKSNKNKPTHYTGTLTINVLSSLLILV